MHVASAVSEDPQAVGMLVAAVILAAGTLSLLYVVVRRRKARPRVWVAAISLGIVLGLSVGGFLRGVHGSSEGTEGVVAPVEPGDEDTPKVAAQGEAPARDTSAPVGGMGVAAVQQEPEPAVEGEGSTAGVVPEAESALAGESPRAEAADPEAPGEPVAPSPADAVKAWGREVRAVTTDSERCADPEELARTWSSRPTVGPDHPERMRAHVAAKWLERCRTRIEEELARRIRLARIDGRREFAETLRGRLHDEGDLVKVAVEGRGEARLRITGGTFDEASAKAMLDDGLRDELAALGFVGVTFARYTNRHRFRVDPRPEAEIVGKELDALGIGSPFDL